MLSESLLDLSLPSASGSVYEGTLSGSRVRVKRIRTYPEGGSKKVKEVRPRHVFSFSALTGPADLLSGSRCVETLGTPKCRPPSGCHHRSPPTRFELDAQRGPDRIHRKSPRRRQTESRGSPFSRVVPHAYYVLTSYLMSLRASTTSTTAM